MLTKEEALKAYELICLSFLGEEAPVDAKEVFEALKYYSQTDKNFFMPLGNMYLNGTGTSPNVFKALSCYKAFEDYNYIVYYLENEEPDEEMKATLESWVYEGSQKNDMICLNYLKRHKK